jgi:hypothetical protein
MTNFWDLAKKAKKTPYYQQEAVASALGYLKNLTSKEKTACGVAPEHREAVRLYVDSWITPTLEAVLGSMLGNERETEWLKERVSKGYNDHIPEGTIDVIKAIMANTTTEEI